MLSKNFCLFVCMAIDSAPGSATDMRTVSLEPIQPEGMQCEKISPKSDQWPSYRKRKFCRRRNVFLWENFLKVIYTVPFKLPF